MKWCQRTFAQVKDALYGDLSYILMTSNTLVLQTDASEMAVGLCFPRWWRGGMPRKWITHGRKRMSGLQVGSTLQYFLLGWVFSLWSDHAPFQWLHCMKDAYMQMTHWYLALQPFKLKMTHSLGSQMVVADFLSPGEGTELAAGGVCCSRDVVWWCFLNGRRGQGERVCWWVNRDTCMWLMNKCFVFSEQLQDDKGGEKKRGESTEVHSVVQACLPFS